MPQGVILLLQCGNQTRYRLLMMSKTTRHILMNIWRNTLKNIIALAIAATALTAAPAMAQEFTGPRVEARLGFDSATLNANGGQATGLSYGGGIGYDYALSPKVRLGVEAAVDSSTADKEFRGLLRADARRDIEVGGRLGYLVSPNTMFYAKAAYSNAQVGYSLDTGTGRVGIGHSTGDGYRVGGGVEVAASKHVYGKVEYRYSDYGNGDQRNQVLTGIGYRF